MNTKIITETIAEIVKDLSRLNPKISNHYSRSTAILKSYALLKNLRFSELRLIDIFDLDNKLLPALLRHISSLERPVDRTVERHKQLKYEYKSNLRSMLREINSAGNVSRDSSSEYSFLIDNLPDFLKPLVKYLPKTGYRRRGSKAPESSALERKRREKHPLSEIGYQLLLALLKISVSRGVEDLELLDSKYRADLFAAIKTVAPSKNWETIKQYFRVLLKELNINPQPLGRVGVPLSEFPPTLRRQFELFKSRAESGWAEDHDMVASAAKNQIQITMLEESTIYHYYEVLSRALPSILYIDDLDIRDLLKLETKEVCLDGVTTTIFYNSFVDAFREQEKEKVTKSKRKGFDTATFQNFLNAVKTIAAFNGFFHLQADFRKHYRASLDTQTQNNIKLARKNAFSIEWLDAVIDELEIEFLSIVKNKRFKLNNTSLDIKESHRNLRFCFFFVWIVTLRYTGLRQQCIRNCAYKKNIFFLSDGSITLRWEANEIKNDKLYEMNLDPRDHELTHGKLIKTLTLYHEKIYKYLQKSFPKSFENQFFVTLNTHRMPRRFSSQKPTDFTRVFEVHAQKFISLEAASGGEKTSLIPHLFRGNAGDWYHLVIGLSVEQTAKALGDAPETIRRKYLRNDQHIATPVLDAAGEILRRKNVAKESVTNHANIVKVKEDLYRANERAELAERRISDLYEQLSLAQQQNLILQQQQSQNHNELIEKLNKLSIPDSQTDP